MMSRIRNRFPPGLSHWNSGSTPAWLAEEYQWISEMEMDRTTRMAHRLRAECYADKTIR